MEITGASSVREVLARVPGAREVFDRFGLSGCGGPQGPDEPLELFTRAHEVDLSQLIGALRNAERTPSPATQPGGAESAESYRYCLRAAALIGAAAGAALGAVNLTWIAVWGYTGWMPNWPWWPALVQAHGNAQLYGWCGLFILGIATHSFPRMLRKEPPPRWLVPTTFGLLLAGILTGLVAQPLAHRPPWAAVFAGAMALQWTGVTLFAGYLLRTVAFPREPYQAFIAAGTVWFWLGASLRLGLAVHAALRGESVPPAEFNSAYLHLMGWGFLLSFVLGYSLRLLPIFAGSPVASPRLAWTAVACLTTGTALGVAAIILRNSPASAAAMGITIVGVGAAICGLRLWAPSLSTADVEGQWLLRFARTAYFWLAAAAVILLGLRLAEVAGPVSPLHVHAFGGASRHALTVGFVSMMIVGVATRILPIFSGAERPHPLVLPAVFGLLLAGNTLRVIGQMASGLWGGGWYALMGVSGWLETTALFLFALEVLRLLAGTPENAALPDVGPEVEVSLEAPVGPLVAHRPWLVPVFARHGMGQVTNPVFQRTVGRRVTVAQACGRFQAPPEQFLAELLDADRANTPMTPGGNLAVAE